MIHHSSMHFDLGTWKCFYNSNRSSEIKSLKFPQYYKRTKRYNSYKNVSLYGS